VVAQLPAHLQGRQVRNLTERASEGMGGALPPHVSIQGNSFTFVDAAGNEMQPMLTFDAVIVDIADRLNKRYYDKKFDPNASTYEPPRCWSANGITPSREVGAPIHPTCEGCPMNVRGSAVSAISGAAIKACRDEKWIAFIVPQLPQVIFQLVITPGSFTNWKAYTETMRGNGIELSFAITRFSFQPKVNGVLLFEHVGWIDEPTLQVVEAANREGKTDALVGRSDPVRQPALAAPAAAAQIGGPAPGGIAPAHQPQQEVIPPGQPSPAAFGQFGQVSGAQAPFGAQTAAAQQTQAAQPSFGAATPATAPAAAPPSEPARRRRRTAAEPPAAAPAFGQTAQAAPQAPFGQPAPAAAAAAPQAPSGGAAPATNQGQFGIGGAMPVDPNMEAMLAQLGFTRAAPQQ
jgi:hypothetical protein